MNKENEMIPKKKYPKIEPKFEENTQGKRIRVILKYEVYLSIFERIKDLRKSLKQLEKQEKLKSKK
ncbi:hypothetical protein A3J41_00505 [candidate division TM6 bacterium RIFCSPHIGHO2_12_FULL_38_8]|nr:MAG: hypothetical protein A3J41_00505 [candidate division TM6 bacterium RIFCSPHIGHO2_12_FULL_38_8]